MVIDLTHMDDVSSVVDLMESSDESEVEEKHEKLKDIRLSTIKKDYNLFFVYNPASVMNGEVLPSGYCVYCRCPDKYCANIVLGKECVQRLEFMIYREYGTCLHDTSDEGLCAAFEKVYTEAVHTKRWTNNLYFPHGYKYKRMKIVPYCVRRGHRKKFLQEFREDEEFEDEIVVKKDAEACNEEMEMMSYGKK
jgi:hypothetical protein